MSADAWTSVVTVVTLVSALSLAAWLWLLLVRGFFWRTDVRLPAREEPGVWPPVCVVVPARDEAAVLPASLPSLLAQDYPGRAEILVIDDGSTDGTAEYLADVMRTPWGGRRVRTFREADVHELMCTNGGLREARGVLAMTWHDDMFLQAGWMVPELIRTFAAYPEIGMLTLSRGLLMHAADGGPETFEESVDWSRVESTIGPAPGNWMRIHEVDAVMRPWVVRRAAIEKVGVLDEAFRPTEWDESDLAYRIRDAGWFVGTHGYERDGAFHHMVNSTYGRSASEWRKALGLRNARLYWERWGEAVNRDATRERRSWLRRASAAGWLATARAALAHATGRARPAEGEAAGG